MLIEHPCFTNYFFDNPILFYRLVMILFIGIVSRNIFNIFSKHSTTIFNWIYWNIFVRFLNDSWNISCLYFLEIPFCYNSCHVTPMPFIGKPKKIPVFFYFDIGDYNGFPYVSLMIVMSQTTLTLCILANFP